MGSLRTSRTRLARVRESLSQASDRYGDWLGVVVRARLACRARGVAPLEDAAILAEHWGVSEAEAVRRVALHDEYIAAHAPDLQALLDDPDLPRRLAEVVAPIRSDGTDPPIP